MKRRAVLKVLKNLGLLFVVPVRLPVPAAEGGKGKPSLPPLFYESHHIEQIRRNARSPLLSAYYESCLRDDVAVQISFLEKVIHTRNLIRDLPKIHDILHRAALVYLVDGREDRKRVLLKAMDTMMRLRDWDYFLEGGTQVIGFQRAPASVIAMVFARQVLGDAFPQELEQSFWTHLAEKGCLPCYRSLWGMRHKDQVRGWGFNPRYFANFDLDFRRWPWILDQTNLKAIPVAGLGLGALALQNRDPRSEEWLRLAETSAREWLQLLQPDGSYHEGLSYLDYALRNLFLFFEAHSRILGTIDWADLANFYGVSEFLVGMQNGLRQESGRLVRDIVNFSDSWYSFYPTTPLWIARTLNDPLAQHAVHYVSHKRMFSDFLWYDPSRKAQPPGDRLVNRKWDLDWVVCRSGWGPLDSVLAFRSGGPANHEHADRNTILFKAYGERLLDDHFGASYDRRDAGWLLRQTAAHNGVLIDGKGHQYHDGLEGTNPSKARAQILRFVDRGEWVWWSSDATPAYRLVHAEVQKVLRTVVFIKPDTVLIFDQLQTAGRAVPFELRFHPDNHDGKARLNILSPDRFHIRRPGAALFGYVRATVLCTVSKDALDLPAGKGEFPFVQISTERTTRCEILTALVARPAVLAQEPPEVSLQRRESGWSIQVAHHTLRLLSSGPIPDVQIV